MPFKKLSAIFPRNSASSPNSQSAMAKEPSDVMDLEDRDPNKLNQHLQVSWEDVIGEPASIRSPECAWSVSNQCFKLSKNFCYVCLSVVCAPVTAFCLGITFACLSFEQIWCRTPTLRVWKISCASIRNFVAVFAHAIIIPCTSACGYFWSEIKVKTHAISGDVDEKKDDVLLV
ncbi:caveolin-2-like [Zophobas morio]